MFIDMASFFKNIRLLLLFIIFLTTINVVKPNHHNHHLQQKKTNQINHNKEGWNDSTSVSNLAILVFGDSTVDPGNNNYVDTIAKSNFLPYGRDLIPSHMPTGRFSNGKLVTDFIAAYLGIKDLVPPYLDTTLSFPELMTGVSFASAGTGYDPLTSQLLDTIPILKQLDYFREYKAKLQAVIGKQRTEDHINKAVFFLSAGTNDFIINYFQIPIRSKTYSVEDFQNYLIEITKQFLQGLLDLGARRIIVVGLPPMGCLPIILTLKSSGENILRRSCIDTYSAVARDYNKILQNELVSIRHTLASYGGRIEYADIYNSFQDIFDNYNRFGFEERKTGCCGTGLLELSILCNPHSWICPDASKYIFWDSVHPSEKIYSLLFKNPFRRIIDRLLSH